MKRSTWAGNRQQRFARSAVAKAVPLAFASVLAAPVVEAGEIDTGNPDVKMRWDNTFKYSAAFRIEGKSPNLINDPPTTINQDDGDRNFNRGLISNRLDLLSEFDLSYKGWGARVSGAAWYDSVYNRSNDNDSPSTANQISVPYNEFTHATRDLHGRKAELLDAFGFGQVDIGDSKLTFRAGKHALLWGESLFFGNNGIAGGQAPIDVIKLLSVPNTQFKELIRPTAALSGQLQINSDVALGAYYQFRWEKTRLPAVGSYFSTGDILDAGGERLITGNPLIPGGGPAAFFRGDDHRAKNSGQGGLQLRYRATAIDTDFGLYAIRYHDKVPQIYLKPSVVTTPGGPLVVDPTHFDPIAGEIGQYYLVYPENIKAYGLSASKSIGDFNLAAEVSVRRSTPLVSDAQVDLFGIVPATAGGPTAPGDNGGNPLYAVGNSLHAQFSWLATLGPSFISREASFLGEFAWNRRTSITRNPAALDPDTTRDAWGIRMVYEPAYRQALPGIDLTMPVGVGYFPKGTSSVVGNFGADKGGDFSIGLTALYLATYRFGLNYTHFFGKEGPFLDGNKHLSFEQPLADRDFVSFTVSATF